jgi:hypothetical protein
MPKNKVSDPITDQEMAFARLILSGTMTDRQAAEAVGLNPDSAAYTKSKPHVRAYMLEHRAAVQQQLVQQEPDLSRLPRQAVGRAVDGLHCLNLDREQVLDRLWEIANLSPEMTRGSITGQVKALSMIVAMQNFIPDRRAASSEKKATPAPAHAQIYEAAWLRKQQATTIDPQTSPAPDHQETQQEDSPGVPACPARPGVPRSVLWEPELAPASPAPARRGAEEAPPYPGHNESTSANCVSPSQAVPRVPYVPAFASFPDTKFPFSIKKNPFGRRR